MSNIENIIISVMLLTGMTSTFAQQSPEPLQDHQSIIVNFSQEYAEKTAIGSEADASKKYSPNILWTILEVQGHKQLQLGSWVSGKNDLTMEQIASLEFACS